jgi:transposase-like protein
MTRLFQTVKSRETPATAAISPRRNLQTSRYTPESNLPDGFAVFALPPAHRRRLRTTNLIECINKEIKRRTRVASLFPNPASALRLVSAILIEKDEEWASGRRYLTMEADVPTHR